MNKTQLCLAPHQGPKRHSAPVGFEGKPHWTVEQCSTPLDWWFLGDVWVYTIYDPRIFGDSPIHDGKSDQTIYCNQTWHPKKTGRNIKPQKKGTTIVGFEHWSWNRGSLEVRINATPGANAWPAAVAEALRRAVAAGRKSHVSRKGWGDLIEIIAIDVHMYILCASGQRCSSYLALHRMGATQRRGKCA